ncbi:ABC transporter substrate-binding protein [Paenibacillus sp. FSL W8-0186]|uniref:ABC transporter substrate-binding protein n=1 Tax=Paenibacillus woosongensis TaxID=307580 RepID=A0ABQ4MYS2_9BACL|nr:ABC transporter substrate-binding protein [Paenibacillus woosongensis]GIP61077.1 ABC transporter substrate-binding protein [Paenibacillus woosongensis]
MKRIKSTLMLMLLVLVVIAGCSQNNSSAGNKGANGVSGDSSGGNNKENITLKIFNAKTEIVDQLNELKQDYEQEHPGVKLQIDTVIGTDYASALKGRFAGNEMPDIFVNTGYTEMETWIDHLEDLSNEPWAQNVVEIAREPITKDGLLYGMPMNLEGYGFIYNKDLFEQAGIKEIPNTITELKAVIQKLEESGIKAFATSYQGIIPGRFGVNVPFAMQGDPVQFIREINDGTMNFVDNPIFRDWLDLIDLELNHSVQNPMTTDYNTQVTLFSSGDAAIIFNGNWIQPMLNNLNDKMNLGIMPVPINDDVKLNDHIYVGVPNFWVVNKNSEVKDQAKEFLNWLVTSETGQRYITDEFKFIPAFNNIEADSEIIGDLAAAVQSYVMEGKTYGWHWPRYPVGVVPEFGSAMQKYSSGYLDRDQLLIELKSAWDKFK